jgi:hypothetical protein
LGREHTQFDTQANVARLVAALKLSAFSVQRASPIAAHTDVLLRRQS